MSEAHERPAKISLNDVQLILVEGALSDLRQVGGSLIWLKHTEVHPNFTREKTCVRRRRLYVGDTFAVCGTRPVTTERWKASVATFRNLAIFRNLICTSAPAARCLVPEHRAEGPNVLCNLG